MACGKLDATVDSGRQGQIPREYADSCLGAIGKTTEQSIGKFHPISRISGVNYGVDALAGLEARKGGSTRIMKYTDDQLNRIYDRTSGYCHICGKKLSFKNYGRCGERGAWHVEHSRPRARGGTDHGNNLYAACIACNLEKSAKSTRTARGWHGRRKAPLSRNRRIEAKRSAAVAGGILGAAVGALGGPWGAIAGALIGAKLGHETDPNER